MRWTSQASACVLAVVLAGCNGGRDNRNNSTIDNSRETGSMRDTGGMSGMSGMSDTSGMTSDTTHPGGGMSDTGGGVGGTRDTGSGGGRLRSDSAKANQTKSGVTNTKTGKSTMGPGVTRTRPDQGQPVTSKGDTLNPGADSTQR